MSSQYNSAPPTVGKVILFTTMGDIEIELWPKEAPKACRNFVQLCLEGYYDNCIFHRIIPNFIVQTGAGAHGRDEDAKSIYNSKKFEDEFHSRLRFSHRGIVACAGQDDQNDSQFFITLESANDLNFKHTIFGKVVGNTIFNVLKMSELEVDDNNVPVYPPKITKVEVLWNPFPDIQVQKSTQQTVPDKEKNNNKRRKKAAVKNTNLLSFGDEVDHDAISGGMESSYDLLKGQNTGSKKTKNTSNNNTADKKSNSGDSREEYKTTNTQSEVSTPNDYSSHQKSITREDISRNSSSSPSPSPSPSLSDNNNNAKEESSPHTTAIVVEDEKFKKRGTLRWKTPSSNTTKSDSSSSSTTEKHRNKYLNRKRSREEREEEALRKISKFTGSLAASKDNDSDDDWKMHKLVFDKSQKREVEKAHEDYEVYDPLTHKSRRK